MESFPAGMLTALWLGILTSISPCPLATNIAAVSYIGKRVADIRKVIISGIVYSIGRMLTYLAVGAIVVAGVISIPAVSIFLQRYMIMIIGPVLILTGMFLLELIGVGLTGPNMGASAEKIAKKTGILGAGLLGIFFALSFCPVSAALFFGSLIPLAINHESIFLLPSLFGIGTGLPVLAFAMLFALSAKSVGYLFNKITIFELLARRATGLIFIIVGIYLTLKYIFNIL
ncbi:MAG: sulfite exporter TauE/SafE family protein [Candidatus Latescibacteria bacterium]|nr:sulfite exporter TauE/SafE family protein [Candidatus Latescibacterota bacterium]